MKVTAVAVTYNGLPWIEKCLESLRDYPTIVVDHGSTDGTLELVRERFPEATLIEQENKGLGAGFNRGMREAADADYFLLINSDAWVVGDAVERMARFADANPRVAVVGPRLRNPDGSLQRSVRGFPTLWRLSTEYLFLRKIAPRSRAFNAFYAGGFEHDRAREAEFIMAACYLVRRAATEEVGLFDERYFMFSEEVDWCWRFHQAGWGVVFFPAAEAVHVGGASWKKEFDPMFREQVRGHLRFLADHKGMKEAERARHALPGGPPLARLVLPTEPARDLSRRRRVAVVGLGELTSTIRAVSSPPQDGRTFRAPAFMRVKPDPPSAAAELAERQYAPAVVCEVGWVNGLGAIRSLGRAGVPVVAVDHRDFAIGFRSSYAFPVRAPDPVADEAGFIAAMEELGDALDRPAPVFPTHDEHLNSLARHKDELGDRFRYPFPDWDVLEPLQSKRHQIEVAESLGLAAPRTLHPRSLDEAREAAREIGYPVLVKPSDNILFKRLYRRQAFLVEVPGDLDAAYEKAEPYEPMLQEFIPGGDDFLWTLGAAIAADGEVLATFSGRKLRQTRTNMGSARVGEALWDEEVVDSGLALLGALKFHGVAQVEWKRDPRDGRLKLIEVNPRLWQWHGLTGACGADVTLAAYWDLVGDRRPPKTTEGCHKRWAISMMHGQSAAFRRPPYVDGVFAADDPKPALVNAVRYALGALGL